METNDNIKNKKNIGFVGSNKETYCANCGSMTHVYKECNEAISSYGVILLYLDLDDNIKENIFEYFSKKTKEEISGISINDMMDIELFCNLKNCIKFLMIRRKHTLGLLEFIRGRYNIDNIEGIIFLFKQMTPEEIKKIKVLTFDELWNDVWGENKNKQSYQNEYLQSKIKFERLKSEDNGYLSLDFYIDNVVSDFDFAEWGFPKGRRNYKEHDLECAIREFKEESGLYDEDIKILKQMEPVEEYFTGTNGINYKHIYYIAINTSKRKPTIDPTNPNQNNEIGDIGFYTYEESVKLIRPYHTDRQKIITELYMYVINNLIKLIKNKKSLVD